MSDGYDCNQKVLTERINGVLKQEFSFYKCNNAKGLKQFVKKSLKLIIIKYHI